MLSNRLRGFLKTSFMQSGCSQNSITICMLLIITTVIVPLWAEAPPKDWPQWQGPDRNAISQEKGLLQEWPENGPSLIWKTGELGGGDSTPSVADGRIFGMSNRGEDEVVWALNEKDGSTIWVSRLGPAFGQERKQSEEGPGSTPTVDGERLYVVGLAGNIACLQVADGKIIWQRSMQDDFGARMIPWSFRESPLVDGDKVICTPGGENATLVALNKLTGETIWKSQAPDSSKTAYSSAIAIEFEGQRQYVQFTAGAVMGVAASDGRFLWQYEHPSNQYGINCSTPIYHDGYIFAASAYDNGAGLAKLVKDENGNIKAEEVYFSRRMQNHHGGMILSDGYLFGANGGNSGGYLACLNFLTGEVAWDERRGERRAAKGSVALADDRLYYRTEEGAMLLLEPNTEKYVEHGRFEQPDLSGKPTWAHPVIANGKLYLRDHDVLLCYDIKRK